MLIDTDQYSGIDPKYISICNDIAAIQVHTPSLWSMMEIWSVLISIDPLCPDIQIQIQIQKYFIIVCRI